MKNTGRPHLRSERKLIPFLLLFVSFAFWLVSTSQLSARVPTPRQLDKAFSREAARLELEINRIGQFPGKYLPAVLPPLLQDFQTKAFNIKGKYMSELEGILAFVKEARRFIAELPSHVDPKPDLTDLMTILFQRAENKRQAAINTYMAIDYFCHSHSSNELIPKLIVDGSPLIKHMQARRIFSDYHFMLAQKSYLPLPFEYQPPREPPRLVKALTAPLQKLPGERGRAIRHTLNLLGLEDLTASIFANRALERIKDPMLQARIMCLYGDLQSELKRLVKSKGKIRIPSKTLWEYALSVSKTRSEAFELLGIFCTQHRTLPKTLLPRVSKKEDQYPILFPLIRTSSIFFTIQEINLLTRDETGRNRFSYAPGVVLEDPRFYHFWSEAFIAWDLLEHGYRPEVVRFVTHNLGRAYETYTLPKNAKFAAKSGATMGSVLKGWKDDITSHKLGAEFAIRLWQSEIQGKSDQSSMKH